MEPTIWGPKMWFTMHTLTLNYIRTCSYMCFLTYHKCTIRFWRVSMDATARFINSQQLMTCLEKLDLARNCPVTF